MTVRGLASHRTTKRTPRRFSGKGTIGEITPENHPHLSQARYRSAHMTLIYRFIAAKALSTKAALFRVGNLLAYL
jgi:hypothetical protein